jgi:hypothetical protein
MMAKMSVWTAVPPIMPAQIPFTRKSDFRRRSNKKKMLWGFDHILLSNLGSQQLTSTPRLKSHPRRMPMGMPMK